jgi:hypothetical protein
VAKGHRGFIDGDFVMVMYGYSPNWLATSHGHEPYNLYVRRSFDGGVTWTTTPAALGGDGTSYDQVHGVGDRVWEETRTLGAGEFEPARNVSQMTSSKETILDPRYSPTNIGTQSDVTRILQDDGTYLDAGDLADVRDPSKFAVVFETGDATVVLTGGEADPWDLFASRATNWGDDWASEDVFAQGRGVWEERWDWVENKDDTRAGESSIAMSPDGQFAWIVWNEWIEHETDINGDGNADVTDADPMFRRLWWDDAVTLIADAGTYTADENVVLTLEGTAKYDGTAELTYEWDLDMDGEFETLGQTVDLLATGAKQGVALRVCDDAGNCDIDQGWVNPDIHAPRVWNVKTVENPSFAGQTVQLTAHFTDPGRATADNYVASIEWGDGNVDDNATITEQGSEQGSVLVNGSHVYTAAGLYTVKVTVTDPNGKQGWNVLRYAVVYDQPAGTVDSNEMTFKDPNGGGTASLEFNAKYWNPNAGDGTVDPTLPEGKLKFQLGELNFVGTSPFEWMVIDGDQVFLKGVGLMSDGKQYHFLVSAVDGKPNDLVRVKIWQGKNQAPVYDSQPGAADDARPTTPINKGGKLTIELN